nr:hypothetical protein Iba_scaffold60574CG0010 [Ipomoea batatas]
MRVQSANKKALCFLSAPIRLPLSHFSPFLLSRRCDLHDRYVILRRVGKELDVDLPLYPLPSSSATPFRYISSVLLINNISSKINHRIYRCRCRGMLNHKHVLIKFDHEEIFSIVGYVDYAQSKALSRRYSHITQMICRKAMRMLCLHKVPLYLIPLELFLQAEASLCPESLCKHALYYTGRVPSAPPPTMPASSQPYVALQLLSDYIASPHGSAYDLNISRIVFFGS